jgi:hypothetical protein
LKSLDRVPKRNRRLVEDGTDRTTFWGLLAIEALCFWKVLLYHVLFLLFPFVFWVLWLTVMKHPADLQNASVPVVSAVGFLSIFWAMLTYKADSHYGRRSGKLQ